MIFGFTAASFFLDWYTKRRTRQLQEHQAEVTAQLQREKNEREYELQCRRLEMEEFDREERRRLWESAWARAEKRREKQGEAMLAAVRKGAATPPQFADSCAALPDFPATDIGGMK